jgi:cystathionine gamma-synthase
LCNLKSLILNPKGKHYDALKAHLERTYEDFYFDEDAIYMERNSRDFQRRVGVINRNTEAVCDFLRAHSLAQEGAQSLIGAPSLAVKDVFYPKWSTRAHYDACALRSPESGFGGLFSLTFTSLAASRAFFDALACQKGPSLGTNFTLACPYTVLAHYAEMDWAAGFGVEEGLVRVSIGLEERALLLQWFEAALRAAEEAHVAAGA